MSETSAYISLYRRFRPQRFSEVVGQEEIVRTLQNAVVADEVAHAYLFAGERGIGKTSIARILARAVNCLSPEGGEPCNACANCKTILSNRSLDILEIDGASNRGIDHIRRLREEVNFVPTDLNTKVYIIDEVHMLTNEAFNALLKTLEEPPPHVVFIFATTEPHKVPRTILSRCQAFDFRKIPTEKIAARLVEIANAEEIVIAKGGLDLVALRANGALRDAIVMLEQAASFESGEITEERVLEMLGLVGREVHQAFLSALEEGDRKAVLETIDSLVERGKDLEVFLADLVEILRDRIAYEIHTEDRDLRLCRGLLDIKQELFRSLDRRILLEVGLLALMNDLEPRPSSPVEVASPSEKAKRPAANQESVPVAETGTPLLTEQGNASPSPLQGELGTKAEQEMEAPPPQNEPAPSEPAAESATSTEEMNFASRWKEMIEVIEQERIAIAAFLAEGTPRLSRDTVTISFHPDYTFHKESLEMSENLQYLAGMVHRHLGDRFHVDIQFDDEGKRNPSARERLREKAQLICQVFDGTIVKEE